MKNWLPAALGLWIGLLFPWGAAAQPVPECPITVSGGCASVFTITVYAHEDQSRPGMRYVYQADPQTLCPGFTARPGPFQGYPIGFEWHHVPPIFPPKKTTTEILSCGDTGRVFPPIFSDGFESGGTGAWTLSVPSL